MSELIFEAGLLKMVLDGSIHCDSEKIFVNSIDSYKYPFEDFLEYTCNLLECRERDQSIKNIKLFIIMGPVEKLEVYKKQWDTKIQEYFNDILNENLQAQEKKVDLSTNFFPSLDLLIRLYLNHLIDNKTVYYPRGLLIQNQDLSMLVYYRSIDFKTDELDDVREILDIWIEKENPMLMGYQVLIRSFILKKMIGRRIISTLPDQTDSNWTLLLEGGVILPLSDSFEKGIAKINSAHLGMWTYGEIEDIILNPAYYVGRHYEPCDLFLEWQYVFFYAIASLRLDLKYDKHQLFFLHQNFLKFIENNICKYRLSDILMNQSEVINFFYFIISQIKLYLIGQEEEGISKNVLLLMRSRYCYLPVIYELVSINHPMLIEESLANTPFKDDIWCSLLEKLKIITKPHEKGIILEEIATYFIKSIAGLKITGRRKRGKREEVDIYFCNVSLDARLWELGALIIVECKNHKKKSTVSDIRNLIPVMDTKGIKSAIIFSTLGFTKDALDEIENQYFNGKLILTVEFNELKELSETNLPYTFLVNKIEKIMEKYEDDLRIAY
ncbi:restriction endonuclease [Paenibacillus elgii]|uniref:restriction endonuclease n=1 Tax=Paenibacillus elgii TaxID=189691 RepID=UPI000FDAEDE4|nr:restriction endonuclease [Paenibacillus elgii]NEN87390.1 restriction endonuclease [Paenibacillus elgii]